MRWIIVIAVAYLLGSIPWGIILGKKTKGIDIRNFGSGNIGATNAYRTLGKLPGILVFLGDVLKGVLAVIIARYIIDSSLSLALAGIMAVLGHNYPVFLKFKGGKGVSTALGGLIVLAPYVALISGIIWAVVIGLSRYISLGSIVAALSVPILMWVFKAPLAYFVFGCLISFLVIFRHKENIKRLIWRKEYKIGEKSVIV